ncbi:MAG: J domain-containing protein [Lentisphaerae bacterium]|nr:J domain-containing protein [Lentisphaerota bacterium]
MKIAEAINILRPNAATAAGLKSAYRIACKKYHPDTNPQGLEMMKMINEAHDLLKGSLGTWNLEDQAEGLAIDEIMQAILDQLQGLTGLDFEICGTWLWVRGATYNCKSELKEAGLKWAGKKKAWYWRPEDYKKASRRVWDMGEIRAKFGSIEMKSNGRLALQG